MMPTLNLCLLEQAERKMPVSDAIAHYKKLKTVNSRNLTKLINWHHAIMDKCFSI